MSIARTKITLASEEEEEEVAAVDEEALAREEQRKLILRALPVDGSGSKDPIPLTPTGGGSERPEGILNNTPPLRPLSSESQERIVPGNSGLLRAVPVPEEEEVTPVEGGAIE